MVASGGVKPATTFLRSNAFRPRSSKAGYRKLFGCIVGHTQDAKQELLAYTTLSENESVFQTPKPTKLAQHPADRLLTNDLAALTFAGCDRLEAIEAVFAEQFGRSC